MHSFEHGSTSNDDALRELAQAMAEITTAAAMESFLLDMCTWQEIVRLRERWTIAKLMHMGFPYRVITEKLGAGSATISRVARSMARGCGELAKACKRRESSIVRRSSDATASVHLSSTVRAPGTLDQRHLSSFDPPIFQHVTPPLLRLTA